MVVCMVRLMVDEGRKKDKCSVVVRAGRQAVVVLEALSVVVMMVLSAAVVAMTVVL